MTLLLVGFQSSVFAQSSDSSSIDSGVDEAEEQINLNFDDAQQR